MATYGISIRAYEKLPVAVKALRSYSGLPMGDLKERLENGEVIELFDSFDFSIDQEYRDHQKKIEIEIMKLAATELELQFYYRSSKDFDWEGVDLAMISNLIESSIKSYYQEHD